MMPVPVQGPKDFGNQSASDAREFISALKRAGRSGVASSGEDEKHCDPPPCHARCPWHTQDEGYPLSGGGFLVPDSMVIGTLTLFFSYLIIYFCRI